MFMVCICREASRERKKEEKSSCGGQTTDFLDHPVYDTFMNHITFTFYFCTDYRLTQSAMSASASTSTSIAAVYPQAIDHLPPKQPNTTRFVLLSDTHTHTFPVPHGDVLLHAGDLTVSWEHILPVLSVKLDWSSLPCHGAPSISTPPPIYPTLGTRIGKRTQSDNRLAM